MSEENHHPYQTIFPTLIFPDEIADLAETIVPSMRQVGHVTLSDLPIIDVCEGKPGDFEIKRELGRGGMGVVHLAEQRQLGREVAIKTTLENHPVSRDALLLEGKIMGMVEHPNVVPVHALGQDEEGRPWIIMKRIVGQPWDVVIDTSTDLDRDLRILSQVCQALASAHQLGIIHRDIKPANVFVGELGEVYLVDWGLALAVENRYPNVPTIDDANEIAGTPAYIAPEMTVGDGSKLGVFTDIYLVGAVLFEIITGSPPHVGKTLFALMMSSFSGKERQYPDTAPTELRDICERAMALDPNERYLEIRDLQNAIAFYLQHRSSMDLTQSAVAKIPNLEVLIGNGDQEFHPALFNEIKFSLRSAINIWHENKLALESHDRILKIMIEHELNEDNPNAARKFLSELHQESAALDLRVKEAIVEHAQRAEKFMVLEKLEYDVDANVGAERRFIPTLLIALGSLSAWPLSYFHEHYQISMGALFLVHGFVVLAFALPTIFYFRKTFHLNFTNRVFLKSAALIWLETMVLRVLVWLNGGSFKLVMAFELILFSVASMQLMLSVDRRLASAAAIYLVGAILVFVFDPLYTYALVGFIANILTAVTMRYISIENFANLNDRIREKLKIRT